MGNKLIFLSAISIEFPSIPNTQYIFSHVISTEPSSVKKKFKFTQFEEECHTTHIRVGYKFPIEYFFLASTAIPMKKNSNNVAIIQ